MATQIVEIRAVDKTGPALRSIESALGRLTTLAAGAFGVAAVSRAITSYQNLTNRLRLVTNSTQELVAVQDQLFGVANRTRQSFEATTELYGKLALNARNLGLTQEQLVMVTEQVNKSLAISGTAGPQAASAILQLSQAFGKGYLNGDEFNSIAEAAPDILNRLAIATNTPIGRLKELGSQGKITGDVIVRSLFATAQQTDEAFSRLGVTLPQALTIANNNFTRFIGKLDETLGASNALGRVIITLSENLDSVAVAALTFGAVLAVGKIVAFTRAMGGAVTAVRALTAALASNPIGLIAVALTTAAVAAYQFIKPLLDVDATIKEKILYAIDAMYLKFKNIFAAMGNIVDVFTSAFSEAMTRALNLEDPRDAFRNFGERIATAFNEGMSTYTEPTFLSTDRYRAIDQQIAAIRNSTTQLEAPIQAANQGVIEFGESAKEAEKRIQKLGETIYGLIQGNSPILKAVEDFQALQAQIDGVSYDEFIRRRNAAFAADTSLQQEALRLAQENISRQIDLEIGKYDLMLGARAEYQNSLNNLQRIEQQAQQGLITLTLEQTTALNDAKLRLEQDYANKRLDIIKQLEEAELTSIQRQMMAYGDLSNFKLSDSQKALLQRKGDEERQGKIVQDRIDFEKKSELEKTQFGLQQANDFFTGVSAYNKKFAAAQKAIAISQAIINTYQGATKALATYPPPFNFIAAAGVIGVGLAQVAAIRAQTAATGGNLITGQPALVGEAGPELIVPKTPSTVIPNSVAKAIEGQGGMSGNQQPVQVNFNISTVDAQGFDELLIRRRGTITGIINQALEKRGKVGVTG